MITLPGIQQGTLELFFYFWDMFSYQLQVLDVVVIWPRARAGNPA